MIFQRISNSVIVNIIKGSDKFLQLLAHVPYPRKNDFATHKIRDTFHSTSEGVFLVVFNLCQSNAYLITSLLNYKREKGWSNGRR